MSGTLGRSAGARPAHPVLGQTVNGARLWVKIGSFQFQPGELAKIFLIVFLAGYLRDKREVLAQGRIKDFGPLFLIWGAAMLVLVQTNDLGSALLQFGIFLAMLYVATGRAAFVAAGTTLFVVGAAAVYQFVDHVQQRVTIWLQPWTSEPVPCAQTGELALRQDCGSFQLVKSLYSIGNGGFGGTGLGKGEEIVVDSMPVLVGRGGQNDVPLDGDEYASAQHARFDPRRDGLWIEDLGSTNGTYVNGGRVTTARRLSGGDVVRVGETDLRYEG